MRLLALVILAALAAARPGFAAAGEEGWVNVQRSGQPSIDGSGRIARVVRAAGDFSSIELEGPTALEVTVGGAPSIEVAADDNLLERITTEIEDGVLRIDTRGSFRTRTPPLVRITLPALDRIRTRGSGDARISGLAGGKLALVAQGSGAIVADGRAAEVEADLYGSGLIDLDRLASPRMAVSLYGSGEARVHTSGELSAVVYGSGAIAYRGAPTMLEERVLGTGEIRRVGR